MVFNHCACDIENILAVLCIDTCKKPGILDPFRPAINLRSIKKVKFKRDTKYRYQIYLKSPRIRGVRVWDMLPATVQKATTKVKFNTLIKKICRIV